MIRVVTIVYPQIDIPVFSADGHLHWDNFACELGLKCRPLQNSEVERLRFKGIDLTTGFCGSRQNSCRVADVRADIQDISLR